MTLGSITFIQFYIALFLVAVAVSNPPRTSLQAVATYVAVAAAAAHGPFGLVLVPLFAGRLVVRRDQMPLRCLRSSGSQRRRNW